jgi:CRP/FNR family transcriptional regulator, transcriptional activator FtrB
MLSAEQREEASRLQIFAGCRKETISMLLEGAFLHKFPERIDLAREGDAADFLHVVISGAVELYARYRDRETTIEVIGPPNSFIAAAVVLDRPHLKSARVIEPARILMLPSASVRKALSEDAAFAARIACELATAYRYITKDLKNQKLRTGLERPANWLVRCDR